MKLILPFPPSLNSLYRHSGHITYMSKKGKAYKQEVLEIVADMHPDHVIMEGRLEVAIDVYPPDRRKRDLDNCLKIVLDSLEKLVYTNDNQIDNIRLRRQAVTKPGYIEIYILEIKQ